MSQQVDLQLTNDPYPTLKMIGYSVDEKNGAFFGPFKDRYFAEAILSIIHNYFQLRSCKDPEPGNRCLSFELGTCPGPCRGKIAKHDYLQIVNQTVEFLEGNTTNVIQILRNEMARNADRLDFEKAEIQKLQIHFCEKFGKRQTFFNLFKTGSLVISENNSDQPKYRFEGGDLTSHGLNLNFSEDERYILDRANIVYQWLHNKNNQCFYYFE